MGKTRTVVTEARFSGLRLGTCFGHVGPTELAGGPIGKLQDGDRICIVVDRKKLVGSANYIGCDPSGEFSPAACAAEL